jgi:drug/metabolite transporter (DMT)-like permease
MTDRNPVEPSRPLPDRNRWLGLLSLVMTAVGWGLSWPFMKLLLREWTPLFSRGVAGMAASLLLAALAVRGGERLRVPTKAIPRLLLAAFTNVFAWMGFSTITMKWLPVGEGALLVFTMPIWAMLFAWPLLKTRPSLRGLAALALALAGIVILIGGQGFALDGGKAAGIAFALAAAICFALGTVLNGSPLPIPRLASVAWQVGLGCLPMLVLGVWIEQPDFGAIDATGWTVLVWLTLTSMGFCYVTWFATLRHLPPATASTGILLVPLIGVISAAPILGEPIGWRECVAMIVTLAGVALALRRESGPGRR